MNENKNGVIGQDDFEEIFDFDKFRRTVRNWS